MGKLNLASIKAAQTATATQALINKPSEIVDSQLSISPASHNAITPKSVRRPEYRDTGSQVRRSKEAQIIIRASPKMRRELKRWAVDEDATVQALIVAGLQALRRERGLPELLE